MIESDHSEIKETNKVKLETVCDFDITIRKRSRIEDSEDEEEKLPTKKHQNSIIKQSEILTNKKNNIEDVSNKEDVDAKREKHVICLENKQNTDEKFSSESDMDRENIQKQDNEQKNKNEISLDKNDSIIDDNLVKIKIEKEDTENKDNSIKKSVTNINTISFFKDEKIKKETCVLIEEKEVNQILDKESIKEIKTKKDRVINNRFMDTEVVDGLELSVECASDKEELSSESENEANTKPRQKTIIIKVKPEESELECSSEEEKSNLQEIINISKNKLEKKNMKRKTIRINSSKIKTSESENSENNNSDEDYNPRTKKKIKRSAMKKKYSTESKRGRNEDIKNSPKKNMEYDDENSDTTLAEKAIKIKNKTEEDLSEKESSMSKSESKNSDDDEKFTKNTREKHSNNRSKDSKHIQTLKRYLSVAGIKVRSYNDIWADCKNNTAKIKRLKELLEKNGVNGRPTLEKCKRIKEKNEKMREISELDVSNIISEGRVTRARRNVDNNKKTIFPNTPSRHREARNTFKRIKTVVDSDSE